MPVYDPDLGKGEEYELGTVDVRRYDPNVDVKIVDWRTDCFVGRGFPLDDAIVLALRRDVDRVEVERLLDEGATHTQVVGLVL